MILNKEEISLVYILSFTPIFLFIMPTILNQSLLFSILSLFISYIFGLIILSLKFKINNYIYKFISIILIIISIYYFANHINFFYLKDTNLFFIYSSIILVSLYIAFKGFDTLKKLSFISSILGTFLIILSILLNIKSYNIFNLDINNYNYYSIIYMSIFSILPLLIYKNYNKKNNIINIYIGYSLNYLSILIIIISIYFIFDYNLINYYKYPFYMSLKKIQLLQFIERIENILISFIIYYSLIFISFFMLYITKKD